MDITQRNDYQNMLEIRNLSVTAGQDKEVISDLSLTIEQSKRYIIMGKNGSGKSSLAHAIVGDPNYNITKGELLFEGKNITRLLAHQRAKIGLFLAWQNPIAIPGISVTKLIRLAQKYHHSQIKSYDEYNQELERNLQLLNLPISFKDRQVNYHFSGGEKKLCEFIQILMLKPKLIILDEIEAGLDLDMKKRVSGLINSELKNSAVIAISHNPEFIKTLNPEQIFLMSKGILTNVGTDRLLESIEENGYA